MEITSCLRRQRSAIPFHSRHAYPDRQARREAPPGSDRTSLQSAPATNPILPQPRTAIAAHRLGGKSSFRPPGIHPINHCADRHSEQLGRAPSRQPTLNRTNNTLSQIPRIRSCHACWPPIPACSWKHNSPTKGIPRADSFSSDNALISGTGALTGDVLRRARAATRSSTPKPPMELFRNFCIKRAVGGSPPRLLAPAS